MNQKGQSGEVFKLLIAAAFSAALLAIIYGYVYSIQPPITGIEAAESVLRSASETPEACFSRDPVHFQEGQPFYPGMLEGFVAEDKSVFIEGDAPFLSDDYVIKYNAESSLSAECEDEDVSCYLWIGSSSCD